jgi:hypothetical protein
MGPGGANVGFRTAPLAALWILASSLACGLGQPPPEAPAFAPATPPDPAPTAPPAPTICTDDCLLVLEHDLDDLEDGLFCELCGASDPTACESGWPRQQLTCDQVDYLRNCIYARLGYDFDTAPEWREVFDQESWYTPRDDFSWSDVNRVQVANAKDLKRKHDRRDCVR